MKTLYIIRGLPGSGKTTLAKRMADQLSCSHYEADQWFEDANSGEYKFNPKYLPTAHSWCFTSAISDLKKGSVVVSNTFTTLREMKDYIETALRMGIAVKVIHCTGNYGSIHNVPEESIERMRARWLDNKKLAEMYDGISVCTW